ncbi:MAG TPA: branched-chain amino acid ABC transporter permease, partial [Rhodospirillaceae bacterium]|nr:branched-chain amino acid ABC transporter permease [Rhodospirillaceae bacterium]
MTAAQKLAIGAVLVALLAVFPFLGGMMTANSHEFYMQQLTTMMILGLFCMSLDLLVGIAGLISLGHAAFFGLGAYLLVLTTPEYSTPSILVQVPLALAGVGLAALVTGALAL